MEKVCASRKTKKYPDVYTVTELRKRAIADGHDSKLVKGLDKSGLCALLGIRWEGKAIKIGGSATDPTKRKAPKKSKELAVWKNRDCIGIQSIKNPSAFKKEELVKLAVKKLEMNKSTAAAMKKSELCYLLKKKGVKVPKIKSIEKKKSKSLKKKVKSPKVKTLKKKSKALSGDCIERSRLKLREHQAFLVNYLKTHRGVIAAFDVGTGKTLTAVAASQCYLDATPKGKVIVVTPVSLQENFRKEMKAYGADPDDPRYELYTIGMFAKKYAMIRFY